MKLTISLGGRYAEAITTDSEDPQDAIRRFKREEYPRVAVSVGMLDAGFDCPGVVNIVFCRPTGSEILYKQIRGRGTRLCAGKRSFLMLDFVGNSEWFDEAFSTKELSAHDKFRSREECVVHFNRQEKQMVQRAVRTRVSDLFD